MKKQQKQLVVLLVIAVVAIIVYIGVCIYNDKLEEKENVQLEEEAKESLLLSIDSNLLRSFSYTVDGTKLEFEKQDNTWVYKADSSIDIDEDAIETMLEDIFVLSKENTIENVEDLSLYGLDSVTNTISFVIDEDEYIIYVGDENSMTGEYYIMLNDSKNVYTITTDLNSTFSETVDDLTVEEKTESEITASEENELEK